LDVQKDQLGEKKKWGEMREEEDGGGKGMGGVGVRAGCRVSGKVGGVGGDGGERG